MTIVLPAWLCVVAATATILAALFLYLIWCDIAAARKMLQVLANFDGDEMHPVPLPDGTRVLVQGVPGALYVSKQL